MGDAMALYLRNDVAHSVIRHASETFPEECCGFLIGEDGGDRMTMEAQRARNSATESKGSRYVIDPLEIMKCERESASRGLKVLGYYHSHPDHPSIPSEFDRQNAWPGYSYLIVSVISGHPSGIRSWRLTDDRSRFVREELFYE